MGAGASGSGSVNIVSLNNAIRSAILANGVSRLQQLYSSSIDTATQNGPINIAPNNVGIIRGFLVKLSGEFKNTGGSTATATASGLANLLSQIQFQDFSNVTRINTTGWHINLLNSAKANRVFAGAYSPNVTIGYGNNWSLSQAGAGTIAANTTQTFTMYYYVPLAYARNDLRGAVYAGLVGATAQLQLTLNTAISAVAADPTLAVYAGAGSAVEHFTNVTVTVYQDYIDQLPTYAQLGLTPPTGVGAASPALPPVDMSTIYELINTNQSGYTSGQDFGIPYTNLRTFMSTSVIFDNFVNGGPYAGTDLNYWALTLANSANVWKYTPDIADLLARGHFMGDPPLGYYYFDHRSAPINTQVYGNANLVANVATGNNGGTFLIGYEAFAMTQTIVGAPSVPS
jgi:hypothetical protein